jgi:hypothetical protein
MLAQLERCDFPGVQRPRLCFRASGASALASFTILIWQGGRSRANLPLPQWAKWAAAAWTITGLASIFAYNQQTKKFWNEIRVAWQEHEQALAKDPRNRQPGKAFGLKSS